MSGLLKRSLIALSIFFLTAPAYPQKGNKEDVAEAAPLGLTWAASKKAVEALGVTLRIQKDDAMGEQAIARNLPKALADAEAIILHFGFEDKLWRIGIASKTWQNDRYGVEAKARFDELLKLLSERYGSGRSLMHVPRSSFHQRVENFAYSISQKERFHAHVWKTRQMDIELSIRANHENTFYALLYEFRPLAESVRKGRQSREREAL